MRKIIYSSQFKRDARKQNIEVLLSYELAEVLDCLRNAKPLPSQRLDHSLQGKWKGFRDCHIKNDLVLIYRIRENTVELVRLGSHAELALTEK